MVKLKRKLGATQQAIVDQLAKGLTNPADISERIGRSYNTVRCSFKLLVKSGMAYRIRDKHQRVSWHLMKWDSAGRSFELDHPDPCAFGHE